METAIALPVGALSNGEDVDIIAEKASRLFLFLADLQSQKERTARQLRDYGVDARWRSLMDIAESARASSLSITLEREIATDLDMSELASTSDNPALLRIERPAPPTPVAVPKPLQQFLTGPVDDPGNRPEFDFNSLASEGPELAEARRLAEGWLRTWETWSRQMRAQDDYQEYFEMHVKSAQQADEYELVLGVGWLTWALESDETIDRPIFTVPVEMDMEKLTGAIEVRESGEPLKAELEVLPANRIADGRFIDDLRHYLSDFEGRATRREDFNALGSFTTNGLSTDARYEPSVRPASSDGRPLLTWAPTLILRPRQRIGLSQTFREIARGIESSGEIPAGLRPLVDPSFEARSVVEPAPGAIVDIDGELFSPLPLNDKQTRVIEHVDQYAHTIVQGPPGTGKTHMAAALLSHLLAQGKRVLVTAQTERALYELRGKLPAEVRELAVSVIGSSSQEMTDLRTAIETIQRRSSNFDETEARRRIAGLERDLSSLREQRTRTLRDWANDLESEQSDFAVEGYEGTLPQAIEMVQARRAQYDWIEGACILDTAAPFPLTHSEIDQLTLLLERQQLSSDIDPCGAILDPSQFAGAGEFHNAIERLRRTASLLDDARAHLPDEVLRVWESFAPAERNKAADALHQFGEALRKLEHSRLPWAEDVHPGIGTERLTFWESRSRQIFDRIERIEAPMAEIAGVQKITVDGDIDHWVPMAQAMLRYLQSGKTLSVRPDGSVKPPLIGGNAVKAFLPFVNAVRINGLPPTTVESVCKYLSYVSVVWELQTLTNLWPYTNVDPAQPVESVMALRQDVEELGARLQQLNQLEGQLSELRNLGFNLTFEQAASLAIDLPQLRAVGEASQEHKEAEQHFWSVSGRDRLDGYEGPQHGWIKKLSRAITDKNPAAYRDALAEGENVYQEVLERQRLNSLVSRIEGWAPLLTSKIEAEETRAEWLSQLYEAEDARRWLLARQQLEQRVSRRRRGDLTLLDTIDRDIHERITSLAAERAWLAAAGSERIDGPMRTTLQAYVQAVRRLGKGTGKYAEQHRRDVRRHLDNARPAVPVWIMPIYKVVEQFELQQNMFDVVIIDEASQAGIESVFLQYLAPKVVVVGDDRQVSPAGVGADRESIRQMARQYLYDFHNVDAWVDPERSLFDDANMRYGGRIALEEHRRCVPEIIEFCNELVYRPSNIELKPVRQVAGERLAPFRITRTPNAFETEKKRVNRAEADVLVHRLQQALGDPDYDGKTIGVISLLSTSGQADYIRNRLLASLPPSVWEERQLKVGPPADFQGAERDVIFLSMVTPVPQEGRLHPSARRDIEQRYNVAVSRAKDQVWLFHSVGMEDFSNHDDLRYKLLEYAYRVAESSPERRESVLVSSDVRVKPFDSLFEQRVYNELVQRGYLVMPQFDAFGRRIDLVVQGENGRLAVECDGDYWHGEEYALADQARQRELERLGWIFVRVFESDFYLDKDEQIQRIIDRLDELDIHPWTSAGGIGAPGDASNVEVVEAVFDDTEIEGAAEWQVASVEGMVDIDGAAAGSEPAEYVLSGSIDPYVGPAGAEFSGAQRAEPRGAEAYEEFRGSTVSVYTAGDSQIEEGLLQIVRVEGPIMEEVLLQRYVKAGGDTRVADVAREVLRSGLERQINRGVIVREADEDITYRLPQQPPVRPRTRGRRSVETVPVAEWRAHLAATQDAGYFVEDEEWFRATCRRVGFQRFTDKMRDHLRAVSDQIPARD